MAVLRSVKLQTQPDVFAHEPRDSLPEATPENPALDGCEHQVDLAVTVEVVTVHPELNAVLRLEQGPDVGREHRAAIGCRRAEVHLVARTLLGVARALQRVRHQVGDVVVVQVGQ